MASSLLEEFKRSWLTSLIGCILFVFGIWILTWNEGNAVHQAHSLDEAFNKVIIVNVFDYYNPGLDDHLVYISGPLIIGEPLTEPEYGVSIQAVKLKRRVQMYQWVEERTPREYGNENSDSSDYYYTTEWRDKLVDSSNFYIRHGHQNPTEIPLKTQVYIAPTVYLGQYLLSNPIKEKFEDYEEITSDERPENKHIKLHMGIYYHCDDIWNPEVGDIRVQFYCAGLNKEMVTIIAQQKGGSLVPYITEKGHEIALVRTGTLNVNQMFNLEHHKVRMVNWKIRGAGIFIMYASCVCLSRLIRILVCRSIYLRRIISNEGTSFSNFLIALSISLVVIAVAWIFYQPMLGLGLIMAAISPLFYCAFGFAQTHEANRYYTT